MRHQNRSHGAGAGRRIQVSHQRAGRLSVQVRGRLIQQQHRRVHQQGTSHRQTLTLTTGKEGTASTHRGAQALRQSVKPLAQTHTAQNLNQLFLARAIRTVTSQHQVTLKGRLENMSRLRTPCRVAAQLLAFQDLTGSQHAAGLQRQKAQNGCKHRRLTGTGGAGHRSPGARTGVHVQVGEDRVIHAGPAGGSVLQTQGGISLSDLHAKLLRGTAADQGGFAGLRRAHSLRIRLSVSRRFGAGKAVGTLTVSLQQLLHLGLRAGTQTLNTTRQNVGVHLSLGRHGTLQGRGGDNTLQGYVAHARGNRREQAAKRGPGADRLNMAQGAFQHTGAQQHHNRRFGGTHGAVNSQRVRNHCARQSRAKPAQGHEGTSHTLSGRALLQGGQVLGVQGAVSLLSGGCHTVSAQILGCREHAGTQAQHLRGGAASQRLRTGIGAEHNPRSHKSADQHGKQNRNQSLRQDARGCNQRRDHDQQVRSRRDNNARHAVTQLINTTHEAFEQRVTT